MKRCLSFSVLALTGLLTWSAAHGVQIINYQLDGTLDPEFGGAFSGKFSYRVGPNVDPDWIDGGFGFRWVGWNLSAWDVRIQGGAFDGLTFAGTEGSSFTFYAQVAYGSASSWTTAQRLFFTSDAGDYLSVDFLSTLTGPFTEPQPFAQDALFSMGNLMPMSGFAAVGRQASRAPMSDGENGVKITDAHVAAVPESSAPWVAIAGLFLPLLLARTRAWPTRRPLG